MHRLRSPRRNRVWEANDRRFESRFGERIDHWSTGALLECFPFLDGACRVTLRMRWPCGASRTIPRNLGCRPPKRHGSCPFEIRSENLSLADRDEGNSCVSANRIRLPICSDVWLQFLLPVFLLRFSLIVHATSSTLEHGFCVGYDRSGTERQSL